MKAAYFISACHHDRVYGPEEQAALNARLGGPPPLITPEHYAASRQTWPGVEMLFAGWGLARLDEAFLARFPDLRIIFYAAGLIDDLVTDAFWKSGCRITTAITANSVPVAEFALAEILFSLKHGWGHLTSIRKTRTFPDWNRLSPPGAFRTTVGLLSLGNVSRKLASLLAAFDLRLLAYDPLVDDATARQLGVELTTLDEVFRRSTVVSCHTPGIKQTERMIRGRHFEAMPPGATFINTARGAIVDEAEMIAVLTARPDLTAVLDVTHPEPPRQGSPLYEMDNVILTPHLAGSLGPECGRMGRLMVEEFERHLNKRPLRHEVISKVSVPAPAPTPAGAALSCL